MSIIVSQPRARRPLSGLGAYAEMLPAIRQSGVQAMRDLAPAAMRATSMPMRTAPMAPSQASMYARQAPARMAAMRGLGDVGFAPALQRQLQQGSSGASASVARITSPQTQAQIVASVQQQAATRILTTTPGTLCDDGSPENAGLPPCGGGAVQFSVEGALPSGVAFVLAAAVGLVVVSMIVK